MAMFAFGAKRWPGIAKLVEECGEVVQVCGKLMMTAGESAHWDGSDLRVRLEDEIGDLRAALDFVVALCGLDVARIYERSVRKRAQFLAWHQEQAEVTP